MGRPDPRIKKACEAMKKLGYTEATVRPVLRQLRKTYENNWDFIEGAGYMVLVEALLPQDEPATKTIRKEEKQESRAVAMSRGKRKALAVAIQDEEDDIDEDVAPLKRRLRPKRERVYENNTSLSLGSPSSKKPNQEDRKQTQLAAEDKDGVYDIDEDECQTGCDNNTSLCLSLRSPELKKPNEEDRKHEDMLQKTDLPPLKRYLRRTGERGSAKPVSNNASPSFSSTMSVESEELPPIKFLSAESEVADKDSFAGALIIVNHEPFTDHKPMIPDAENCSAPVLEMEKSFMFVEERDGEIEVTLNDTTAMDVLPSETVSDMIKTGDESGAGAADISMELVVVPDYEISADRWRALSSPKDITVGKENVEIPWVNEINDEVPPRFRYIGHCVVFQDAAVKFSVSSVSDDQACFSCIGDCLDSSPTPCNCTIAYTVDGLLKEDFLEARISEARDQRKQVLQFCQECPLEKAKKEEVLEPCKGHIKRKAIKECWIKCGCGKRCGNRLVQRGIHNKLEVFFTPNGKGWGLRTLERLPQGAFVSEYVGEVLTIPELYQRSFDNKLTSPVILDARWGSKESLEDNKSLCLDGTRYGNISRFLNHRCLDANLIEIPVHVETPDQHYYHIAFFTTRDIEAMEELTWDYGIDFKDDDCPMKPFDCLCGSRFCRNAKRSKKAKKVMMNIA
uniref:Histone-lysine N-methyltransferase SUVR1 n=1 Tax=Noccaea caerulescens TaxID=107243 RepID=A0A1J3FTG8_NOCCA